MMSGMRDREGFAKDLIHLFFPLGASEPLKFVEQERFINTVLGQQCARWPGVGRAKF